MNEIGKNTNTIDRELAFREFVSSLMTRYVAGYYLDLENKTFVAISQEKEYEKYCGKEGDLSKLSNCLYSLIIEEDHELTRNTLQVGRIKEYLTREQNYSIEIRDHALSEERWLRCRILRGHDENHAALTLRDITEDVRQGEQTKETLKREQLLKRHLNIIASLSLSYVNINYVDLTNGAYQELTNENLNSVGQLRDNFSDARLKLSNMVDKYIVPEYQQQVYDFIELSTVAKRLEDKDVISMQYLTNNIGWVEGSFVASRRDAAGKCIRVLWAVRSIQEQKEKDEMNHKMMDALAESYLNVYLIDTHTRQLSIVKMDGYVTTGIDAAKIGPYPYDTIVNSYIGHRVYIDDITNVTNFMNWDNMLKGVAKETFYELTYRVMENNVKHYYQGRYRKLDDRFVVAGFQNIDEMIITEKRRNEELERARKEAEDANEAKTSFLFNMSHDIRTPMNAIIGFRDLLEKHQEDAERRADYLSKIENSSSVLLSIINNVLEMARIERGTLEIEDTAWSAGHITENLFGVFNEMMEQKGIAFTFKRNIRHPYIFCDVNKVREIIINLLSNAYKYTNSGGSVELLLEEVPCEREGYTIYNTIVSDTGIGMSEDFIPHLFEEFSREQNTTQGRIEGTGLGMPIVKRLVELLGGTIEVESKKGVGSKFTVSIPHRIADRKNLVTHAGVEVDPKVFKNKRILLAEDNDLNAEIAAEILTEAGFVIERAEDGAICVDMLTKAPMGYYDLVLMDVQMPNMNGYDATRAIRQMADTSKSDIPILAMTANVFEEDKRAAMRSGMNGHVSKPIDVKNLMQELANILA